MALEFQIITGSSTPVYRQIVDQVRKAVASGAIDAGEQLPSVRVLAEHLVINPNTVARAYADLTRDGVLESQPGKGLFIAERRQVFSDDERRRRLDQAIETFLNDVVLLDFSQAEILNLLKQRLSELLKHTKDSKKAGEP